MLDDLKYIHNKDASDALGIAAKEWQQLQTVYKLDKLNASVDNVVFAGMGGSALWAVISMTWPGYTVPFEIWRRYDAPAYISKKTLMVISSYSGNTEEVLSALEAAEKAGAQIVISSGGGKLIEIAKEKGYPYTLLPAVAQPRFGTFNGLKSLVTILEKAGLVKSKDAEKTLHESAAFIKQEVKNWLPDVPTSKNPAKKLALELAGTSPVIYAGHKMMPAAYKWKISFNENAKNVAWWNEFPEFSHNEFIGWMSHPVDKPYGIVELRSSFENPRILKRFEVSDRLLSGKRPAPHIVNAVGDSILEQILYCVNLGDFVSLYVALLNGIDPSPIDIIEKMKKELNK